MQSQRQIQHLLLSAGISPNKRLGQHFLIDLNLMRLLVDSADIQENDVVLEIGCGTGSLTEALVKKASMTIAVELDHGLAEIARAQLDQAKNFELINTDILENKSTINVLVTDALARARKKCGGRILLVANLPYNVASPVTMNLATGPTTADRMYVTVQKEVADRMTARPGSTEYGTLSILLGATGEVKTIRTLRPTVFWPQPQVDSAMISFVRDRDKCSRVEDMGLFRETVHTFMSHRRKTLAACCRHTGGQLAHVGNWAEVFSQCRIDPARRPETLGPDEYVAIAGCAAKYLFLC